MRILTTLAVLLASFIPAFGATTWPAGTNTANQTFFGNNNFLGTLKQNGVNVLTNVGVLGTNNLAPNVPQTAGSFLVWRSGTNAMWTTNLTWDGTTLTLLSNGVPVATINTNGAVTASKFFGQPVTASFGDFLNVGTTVVISPTNGNLQSWILTAASSASMDAANTNFTETVRLNVYGSNTLTWATTTLSNATVLGPTNAINVMIFDHARGTNLWWSYRLR